MTAWNPVFTKHMKTGVPSPRHLDQAPRPPQPPGSFRPQPSPMSAGDPGGESLRLSIPRRGLMQTRYAIRWSRLPEVAALAASAIGLIAVVAGLV